VAKRHPFPPERERRRWSRVPLDTTVGYRPNGDARPGRGLNVSAGGLGFQSEAPLDPGTVVLVELRLPPDAEPIQAAGRVCWSQAAAEPACGLEFTDLTDEAREQILAYIERVLRAAVEVADAMHLEEE